MSKFKMIVLLIAVVLAGLAVAVPPWEDVVYVAPHGDMGDVTYRQDFLGYSPMWAPPALGGAGHDVQISWFAVGGELVSVVLLIAIGFVLEPKPEHPF